MTMFSKKALLILLAVDLLMLWVAAVAFGISSLKFEISFPAAVHAGPITGRVLVMISRKKTSERRLQVGAWGDAPPFFASDVGQLRPGETAQIDASALGYPLA